MPVVAKVVISGSYYFSTTTPIIPCAKRSCYVFHETLSQRITLIKVTLDWQYKSCNATAGGGSGGGGSNYHTAVLTFIFLMLSDYVSFLVKKITTNNENNFQKSTEYAVSTLALLSYVRQCITMWCCRRQKSYRCSHRFHYLLCYVLRTSVHRLSL